METSYWTARIAAEVAPDEARALRATGWWMRAGFVGASALAIGLIMVFGDNPKPLAGLVTAILGGALAAFAWRRAYQVLDGIDDTPPAPANRGRSAVDDVASSAVNQLGHA